jgi:hypothetical protein
MKEKFPVKYLTSSQKFVKSSVLCDLILSEISLHCGIVVLYLIDSLVGIK